MAIHDALIANCWLTLVPEGYALSREGAIGMESMGVDVAAARGRRRQFARSCLDWTHRRNHLAGALAAALRQSMMDANWIRAGHTGRGVNVTEAGLRGIAEVFDIHLSPPNGER